MGAGNGGENESKSFIEVPETDSEIPEKMTSRKFTSRTKNWFSQWKIYAMITGLEVLSSFWSTGGCKMTDPSLLHRYICISNDSNVSVPPISLHKLLLFEAVWEGQGMTQSHSDTLTSQKTISFSKTKCRIPKFVNLYQKICSNMSCGMSQTFVNT